MRKAIVTILALAMIPLAAMAQGGPNGGPGGPGGGPGMRGPGGPGGKGPRMAEELGLTEDQVKKMREIHQKNRKTNIDQKSSIQKSMIDLTDELQKEKPDKATVDKIIDQIVKTKGEMERTRLNTLVETTAILTPEQKKKAAEKMAGNQFMGARQGGFGGGGPGGRFGGGGPGGEAPDQGE